MLIPTLSTYSHIDLIIPSRINIGPVAEIIFNGCPANNEKKTPHIEPARIHSIVAM